MKLRTCLWSQSQVILLSEIHMRKQMYLISKSFVFGVQALDFISSVQYPLIQIVYSFGIKLYKRYKV